MKLLGNVTGPTSMIAWAVAIGGTVAYQFYKRNSETSATFSSAEAELWNAKRKAELDAKAAAPKAEK